MISASKLASKKIKGLALPYPYDAIFGNPESSASILVYSEGGNGKSSFALQLMDMFTHFGPALYCSSEEGEGFTMRGKVQRLGLENPSLYIDDWPGYKALKSKIKKKKFKFVCIDSITDADPYLKDFEGFMDWAKENGVLIVLIAHVTKGGNYKGSTLLHHKVGCVVKVIEGRPSTLATGKNRYGELSELDIDFRQKVKTGEAIRTNEAIPVVDMEDAGEVEPVNRKDQIKPVKAKDAPRVRKDSSSKESLIYLGTSDQLDIDSVKTDLPGVKGDFYLLSSADKKTLYLVNASLVTKTPVSLGDEKTHAVYKQWHSFDTDGNNLEIDWPSNEPTHKIGTAKKIYYASDKIMKPGDAKGKDNLYKHDFDAGKRPVLVQGQVVIIENIKWNERGILN